MSSSREKTIKKINKYNSQGKFESSIELLKELIKAEPENIEILNLMASTCEQARKKFMAIKYFHQSANLYLKEHNYEYAAAIYKKILKIDPNDPESYENIARVSQLNNNFSGASNQLCIAAQKYREDGNDEKALNLYEKAIKLDPSNKNCRIKLIELYKDLHQHSLAIEQYMYLAEIAQQNENIEDAQKILENLLKIDPNNMKAMKMLVDIYKKSKDREGTLRVYRRIFSSDGIDADTAYLLSEEYLDTFDDPENTAIMMKRAYRLQPDKIEILQRIKEITPNDLETRQILKDYYIQCGRKEDAANELIGISEVFKSMNNIKMSEKLIKEAEVLISKDKPKPDESKAPPMTEAPASKLIPKDTEKLRNNLQDIEIRASDPEEISASVPHNQSPPEDTSAVEQDRLNEVAAISGTNKSAETEILSESHPVQIMQNKTPDNKTDTPVNYTKSRPPALDQTAQNHTAELEFARKQHPSNGKTEDTLNVSMEMNTLINSMVNDSPADIANDDETRFNLGMSYMEMALYDDAISEFLTVVDLKEFKSKTCRLLGLAYSYKNNHLEAIKWYKKSVELLPSESEERIEVLFTIGDLYLSADDYENARKYFLHVSQKKPAYHGIAEKLSYIEQKLKNP